MKNYKYDNRFTDFLNDLKDVIEGRIESFYTRQLLLKRLKNLIKTLEKRLRTQTKQDNSMTITPFSIKTVEDLIKTIKTGNGDRKIRIRRGKILLKKMKSVIEFNRRTELVMNFRKRFYKNGDNEHAKI